MNKALNDNNQFRPQKAAIYQELFPCSLIYLRGILD